MSYTFKHTSDSGRDICEKGPLVNRSLLLLLCNESEHSITRQALMDSTTDYWSPELERLWSALTWEQWMILVSDRSTMVNKVTQLNGMLGEVDTPECLGGTPNTQLRWELMVEIEIIYRDFFCT